MLKYDKKILFYLAMATILGGVFLLHPDLKETGVVILTGVGTLCLNRARGDYKNEKDND